MQFLRNILVQRRLPLNDTNQEMHQIEFIGRDFDSFYIPIRELIWRRLKPVAQWVKNSLFKIPLGRPFLIISIFCVILLLPSFH